METNETTIDALLTAGQSMKKDQMERAREAAKLNAHDGWFGLQAFKRQEAEKAGRIFKAIPALEQLRVAKESATAAYEEAKQKHAPEAVAALNELTDIQKAMKAFILKGETSEVNGVKINSLESCLSAYGGIKQRMVMLAQQ